MYWRKEWRKKTVFYSNNIFNWFSLLLFNSDIINSDRRSLNYKLFFYLQKFRFVALIGIEFFSYNLIFLIFFVVAFSIVSYKNIILMLLLLWNAKEIIQYYFTMEAVFVLFCCFCSLIGKYDSLHKPTLIKFNIYAISAFCAKICCTYIILINTINISLNCLQKSTYTPYINI